MSHHASTLLLVLVLVACARPRGSRDTGPRETDAGSRDAARADGSPPPRDAFAPGTDAFVPGTDAFVPGTDAFVARDAAPTPDAFVSRDVLTNGEGASRWTSFGYTGRIPLAQIAPGRYLLRIEAQDRSNKDADGIQAAQTVVTVR
jgi:hypothetical protein